MQRDVINIILADDSTSFMDGLELILAKSPNCVIIDKCYNGKELLECPNLHKADLLITDIEMPLMNGIEAARRINYVFPFLPMIAITMHQEKIFLQEIIMAGFKGFIYKPEVSHKLNDVIQQVLNDKFAFPNNLKI